MKKKDFVKVFFKKLNEVIQEIATIEERKQKGQGKRKGQKRRTSSIGVLHAILPYFHYQTYYLCKNPDTNILKSNETVADALKRDKQSNRRKHVPLSLTQLGRIVTTTTEKENGEQGNKDQYMNDKLVYEHLDTLQRAGALMYQKTKGKLAIKIHPHLLFSMDGNGTDEYTKIVVEEFDIHD